MVTDEVMSIVLVRAEHFGRTCFGVGPSRPFHAEAGDQVVLKFQVSGAQEVAIWTRDQSTTLVLVRLSDG